MISIRRYSHYARIGKCAIQQAMAYYQRSHYFASLDGLVAYSIFGDMIG